MRIKNSVKLPEINKYTVIFLGTCLSCESALRLELTLTSANDSVHSADSLHYEDKAWDLRAKDKSQEQRLKILQYLRFWLGWGWDVILETSANPTKHHFHIERDTRNYPEG